MPAGRVRGLGIVLDPSMAASRAIATDGDDVLRAPVATLRAFLAVMHSDSTAAPAPLTESVRPGQDVSSATLLIHSGSGSPAVPTALPGWCAADPRCSRPGSHRGQRSRRRVAISAA